MKIAVIADIHGNLPAFEKVLEDARNQGAERYILVGDYIFDLPWSNEVTEAIRSLDNAIVIQGNKEGYLPGLISQDRSGWVYDQFGPLYQTIRELKPENSEYLMALPPSASVSLPSGRTLFVTHWLPELAVGGKRKEISSRIYREETGQQPFSREEYQTCVDGFLKTCYVQEVVQGLGADVIVFGHTHLQWHGWCGDTLVLNPGSCGLPLDGDNSAAYTLLTDTSAGIQVEERHVVYDVEAVIHDAKQSEVYRKGKVWVELVFAAMRSGFDTFAPFMSLAERLANERGQSGIPYSNDVWSLAFDKNRQNKPE